MSYIMPRTDLKVVGGANFIVVFNYVPKWTIGEFEEEACIFLKFAICMGEEIQTKRIVTINFIILRKILNCSAV